MKKWKKQHKLFEFQLKNIDFDFKVERFVRCGCLLSFDIFKVEKKMNKKRCLFVCIVLLFVTSIDPYLNGIQ